MSPRAYVGLGANLGERATTCRAALALLLEQPGITLHRASSFYETEPQGRLRSQPRFLNAVVALDTLLTPTELLELLLSIEDDLGRTRTVPQGPRDIDLDLLLYGELCLDTPELTLPHPRLLQRRFVLVPLLEVAPELRHPQTGRRLADHLAAAPPGEVTWCPELNLLTAS